MGGWKGEGERWSGRLEGVEGGRRRLEEVKGEGFEGEDEGVEGGR